MESNFENSNNPPSSNDIIIEEIKDFEGKKGRNHAGNGRQAGIELAEEMAEIKKIQERIKKDLERFERDKAIVAHEISEINARIKEATEAGNTAEMTNWRLRLKNAQELLGVVEKTAPSIDPLSNEAILSELKDYRQARERQIAAETLVNKNKDDHRALGDYLRAQAEAAAINDKIQGLIKKRDEENILAVSSPVRDDGFTYTHEQAIADELAWKKRHREIAEELAYKNAVAAELAQKKEEEEKARAQKISIADMEPASIIEKNDPQRESRMQETLSVKDKLTERLEVIRENTDPDSILEKERIETMLVSLNKDFKDSVVTQEEVVPIEPATKTEKPTPEPQATTDTWQEEAINTFENEGGKIPEIELLPNPENDPNLLPVAIRTEEKKAGVILPPIEGADEALAKIGVLMESILPLETQVLNEKEAGVSTSAQNQERALSKIKNVDQLLKDVHQRAEKAGALNHVREVGEWWSKIPTHYKLMLSVGIVASGTGAAVLGASATVGAIGAMGVGVRAVGGAGMFVAFERMLKNDGEKNGEERTKSRELTDTALAATLAILVAGLVPKIVQDSGIFSGLFDKISGFFGGHTVPLEVPVEKTEVTVTSTPAEIYTEKAVAGDSVWKMAERQLVDHYGEKFTALTPEKQTYFIDAIKDAVAENPSSFGMTDADTLAVGQEIDFKTIFENKDFMDTAFEGAQDFVPEIQPDILAEAKEPKEQTLIELLTGESSPNTVTPIEDLITEGYPEKTTPIHDLITEGYPEQTPTISEPVDVLVGENEITNPQSIVYANEQLRTIVKDVFGKKGWLLGIGSTDGMEIFRQFANKSVDAVLNTDPKGLPQGTTEKVQNLIYSAQEQSKVMPKGGETLENYLKRAGAITIDKFLKTGTIVK